MRLPFRKPLVVVAPKKLLKFRGACSNIEEFSGQTRYLPLISDKNPKLVAPEKVRKVVLCCGQVYYDLEAAREKEEKNDIAILRVESLCPFPFKEIITELKKYNNASLTWSQEEPKNAGSWLYAQPRLRNINEYLKREDKIEYAGRKIMGSTAGGFTSVHNTELEKLVTKALS